jgi:hypothetical protein
MTNTLTRRMTAGAASVALVIGGLALASTPAQADEPAAPALTNLAHLDFLLDEVSPAELEGHTSYRLDTEPALTLPWTYADARDGGTFERVGGGPLDPATGDYGQGAYNSDDVARAAVVYLRHWQQTGDDTSRQKAYEVLRALAYFQTTTGEDAGNVVLWMQPDGELNRSAEPVELPDPSDSAESYWLARTLWAFGEGFAAFQESDPSFAAFLQERLQLGVAAVDREVLDLYGQYVKADGVDVPAWLIVDGADATAEAVLGLSAYSAAEPSDTGVRDTLAKLAEGVAAYGRTTTDPAAGGDAGAWPYGAMLPWAESRSMWHAWSSQMAGALARASVALGDSSLLQPAVTDSARFAPTLLTAGGPDNGWYPSPTERVQIAYGVDSRVQNLLATADAAGLPGLADLAGLQAAWYFGLNPAGEPMYDPATGVTYDGIQPDGSINRNSGAESTIHGLLSMLALDAHSSVAALAQSVSRVDARDGLTVVEAEDASSTTGAVVTPESTWTEESSWSGSYLALEKGQTATFEVPAGGAASAGAGAGADGAAAASGQGAAGAGHGGQAAQAVRAARVIEPVIWQVEKGAAEAPRSLWRSGVLPLGVLSSTVGEQGITAVPGALLPQKLTVPLPGSRSSVEVRALSGTVQIDALLVRPVVSSLAASGSGSVQLAQNALRVPLPATIGADGVAQTLRSYDASGVLVEERAVSGPTTVWLRPGGFALAIG